MATNRFVCEICNKGFQRDQNLQLHRRGHNLPWKLKQRANKDVVRKKVYVCPETSCVHHDPSRALGDLTGIKKHFSRKHGEKKWKCDKCSKRYAVQSDWKAHSKTCGTREYRCDCGTLFSRRDSFITHRAFCDALAEESARGISSSSINNIPGGANHHQLLINSSQSSATSHSTNHNGNNNIINPNNIPLQLQHHQLISRSSQEMPPHLFSLKKEPQTFNLRHVEIPPWLACSPASAAASPGGPGPPPPPPTSTMNQESFPEFLVPPPMSSHENPNPSNLRGPNLPPFHPAASSHISATALLQKAAQMGATMSNNNNKTGHALLFGAHQGHHVSADSGNNNNNNNNNNNSTSSATNGFGLNLSSRDQQELVNGLAAFGNKAADSAGGAGSTGDGPPPVTSHQSFLQDMMMASSTGFGEGSTFLDHHHHHLGFGGIFMNPKKDSNFMTNSPFSKTSDAGNAGNDGMTTRDFLGLKPSEFFSIADLGNCMSDATKHHQDSSHHHHHHHDEEESWEQQG
ncbi:OLC1v1015049C1 [Oldenlandia corymbosa var. corymbosa]|nr:OLC1v1015049C1 [Oldenlandia corymbosa var. corymbosa]